MADKKTFASVRSAAGSNLHFSANDPPAPTEQVNEIISPTLTDTTEIPADIAPPKINYDNLLEILKEPEDIPCKNVSFYLETDIIKTLNGIAKKTGISRSKIVNKFLRQLLFTGGNG
jgi:hypothetical protein